MKDRKDRPGLQKLLQRKQDVHKARLPLPSNEFKEEGARRMLRKTKGFEVW